MDQSLINPLGDELYQSLLSGESVEPLTDRYNDITIEDAYQIQQRTVKNCLDAGQSVIGKKIGVTSTIVQQMLNVHQPDFGWLLSDMLFNDGAEIDASRFIAPKIEGEIAFILKKDLLGPGITSSQVLAATEAVMPCYEIVDSRIKDWKIKIQDTVADNASCGAFVLGDTMVNPNNIDLALCGMVLEKNGALIATGAGAAAMGHPASAVAWLANTLGPLGIPLKAGEVVLSGSLSSLIPVMSGDVLRMDIGGLGGCSVHFS